MTGSHCLKITNCRTISSGGRQSNLSRDRESTPQTEEKEMGGGGGGGDGGEIVTVLFSARCAKFLDLQVGQTIRIHPPWWGDITTAIC